MNKINFNFDTTKSFETLVKENFAGCAGQLSIVHGFTYVFRPSSDAVRTKALRALSIIQNDAEKYKELAYEIENMIFYTHDNDDEKEHNRVLAAAKNAALNEEKNRHNHAIVTTDEFNAIKSAFFNDNLKVVDGIEAWNELKAERQAKQTTKTPGAPRVKTVWDTCASFEDLSGKRFTYNEIASHKKVIFLIKDFVNNKDYWYSFEHKSLRVGTVDYYINDKARFFGKDMANIYYISTKAFMHFVAKNKPENFIPYKEALESAKNKYLEKAKNCEFMVNNLDILVVDELLLKPEVANTALKRIMDDVKHRHDTQDNQLFEDLSREDKAKCVYAKDIVYATYPLLQYISIYDWEKPEVIDYIKSVE